MAAILLLLWLLLHTTHSFLPARDAFRVENVHRKGLYVPTRTTVPQASSANNNDAVRLRRTEALVRGFQTSLDTMYVRSLRLKCPFMKRRATDLVDGLALVAQFICARHKSLPALTLPGSQRMGACGLKAEGLSMTALAARVSLDWAGGGADADMNSGKGYYITGKLTKEIYRDDCFFDGPDPDMPVVGLRKYISSTAQLFDQRVSRADVVGPVLIDDVARTITVRWRLEGVLNLPWHPRLKPWTGATVYHVDASGLVEKHVESWDITVFDAFASTLFPFLRIGQPPAPPLPPASGR
jgi:hypothetical protein